MKEKNCLIFGGSGQIGRNLIRKLTKNNYRVTVVTRNIHQKSYIIKTQANAGYIDIVESNIFDEIKIRNLFKEADICINLIGILFEKGKVNSFKNIHENIPFILSKLCSEYNLEKFIHLPQDLSIIFVKIEGEKRKILDNFAIYVEKRFLQGKKIKEPSPSSPRTDPTVIRVLKCEKAAYASQRNLFR